MRSHTHVAGFAECAIISLLMSTAWSGTATGATRNLRLVDAVKNRDVEATRQLLKQGLDVNIRQADGATALHWAAHWDDVQTATLLIRAGALVNVANEYGVTPLSMACLNASAAMVELLLEAGADPHASLPSGETSLMTASLTGNPGVVRTLLARGVNVNARESSHGQSALMWAVAERHLDIARLLIANGADVRARSTGGFTPLMFAARQGDLDGVKLLLANGADVNAIAHDGISVLHVATLRGHTVLARYLLDQGANPNANGPGYSPLHWAVGAWETIDEYSGTSAEWSALAGLRTTEEKVELVKALVAHGADVNMRLRESPPHFGYTFFAVLGGGSIAGATPFLVAAMAGEAQVMRLLVSHGADPRLSTIDGTTPLMVASGLATVEQETRVSEARRLEAARLCVELGADINVSNRAGNTALHAAAYLGYDSIAQLLVDSGASLNARNSKGETPLKVAEGYIHLAQVFSHKSTAALLQRLGGTR